MVTLNCSQNLYFDERKIKRMDLRDDNGYREPEEFNHFELNSEDDSSFYDIFYSPPGPGENIHIGIRTKYTFICAYNHNIYNIGGIIEITVDNSTREILDIRITLIEGADVSETRIKMSEYEKHDINIFSDLFMTP